MRLFGKLKIEIRSTFKINILFWILIIVSIACKPRTNKQLSEGPLTKAYSWEESDTTLRFINGSELIWQFNFRNRKGKSYFHPLKANGINITSESPSDHPWHLGLWFSWKYIDGLNYWEYKDGFSSEVTGFRSEGVTTIEDIQVSKNQDYSTSIELKIKYHPEEGPEIMKEERIINISPPMNDGSYLIDYYFRFSSINKDVLLDRTPLIDEPGGQSWGGYAGMSIRYNQELKDQVTIIPEAMDTGSKDDFMYMGFLHDTTIMAGLAIFRNPDYSTEATGWYITTDNNIPFYYYSPSALYDSSYLLKQNEDLILKYRVWVLTGDVYEYDLTDKYKEYLK